MTKIEYIGKTLLIEINGKKILVVGDLHLGYEEALNRVGVFVSRKLFDEVIEDFERIFGRIKEIAKKENKLADKTKRLTVNNGGENKVKSDELSGDNDGVVDEIVLLGDVKHVFGSVLNQEWGDVLRLIDYFNGKMKKRGKIIITRGNHDAILEPIAKKRENVQLVDYY